MNQFLVMALLLPPLGSHAGALKLTLQGAGIEGKTLYVAVHTLAADFPARDDKALRSKVVATGDTAELLVPDVPAGEYAVAVFADSNGNGKLDNNFFGIPKEPVGVSRNAKGRFGPPTFADAAIRVGDGVTSQTIQLK